MPRFVGARRLGRRPDEEPGEQERERRVVLHEREEAREKIGALHERARERGRPAERDVVAASAPGLPTIELVLLRVQPRVQGGVEDRLHQRRVLPRGARRRDVDLEHTRIGGNGNVHEVRRLRRRVAFEDDAEIEASRCSVDRLDQLLEARSARERWQEDKESPLAWLDAEGGSDAVARRALRLCSLDLPLLLPLGEIAAARIGGPVVRFFLRNGRGPAFDGVERKTQSDWAVSGHDVETLASERPLVTAPAPTVAGERENEAGLRAEAAIEQPRQPPSLLAVAEILCEAD